MFMMHISMHLANPISVQKKMELTDIDYDNMSLTDLAELRRLFCWLIEQKKTQETEEIKAFNKKNTGYHLTSYVQPHFIISGNLYCNPQKNRGTFYDGTGHKTTGSIFNYTT